MRPPRVNLYAYEAALRHGCDAAEVLASGKTTLRAAAARRDVIRRLRGEGWKQDAIAAAIGRDRSTVSYHLRVWPEAGSVG